MDNTELVLGKPLPQIPLRIQNQIDAILKAQAWAEDKFKNTFSNSRMSTLTISKLFLYGMYLCKPELISFDCTNKNQRLRHIFVSVPVSVGVYPDNLNEIGRAVVECIIKAAWEEIETYSKGVQIVLGASCPVTNIELKENTKEGCSFIVSLRYRSYNA